MTEELGEHILVHYPNGNIWRDYYDERGPYLEYYEDGGAKVETNYRAGKFDGVYRSWWPGDRRREESNYREGVRHGKCIRWYPDGCRLLDCTYVEGEIEGKYESWHDERSKGNRRDVVATWHDGKLTGPFCRWHRNGRKSEECCYDGEGRLDGVRTVWNDQGHKIEESVYRGGTLTERRVWYDNVEPVGLLASRFPFSPDTPTKVPAGYLKEETMWRAGKIHGLRTTGHDVNGRRMVSEYRAGEMVKVVSLVDGLGRETVLPEGEIDVWKACVSVRGGRAVYVHLVIPHDARRVTPADTTATYKSRVEYAVVIGIEDAVDPTIRHTEAESSVYGGTRLRYVLGQEVRPDGFDPSPALECGHGIHVHRYRDHCTRWMGE